MTDYAKLKNDELQTLLKERSLPHTGKKAEMVARLQEDDKKKASVAAPTPSAPAVPAEDVIDWDDDADAPAATSKPAAAALAAGGQGQVANPQAVPNQVVATDPATTDDLSVKAPNGATNTDAPAAVVEEKKPEVDFSRGLAATDIEAEIEKRRKRAEKFGLKIEDDKDAQEAMAKLERLKKFGGAEAPKGLDEALPERQRKRGRDAGDEGSRGGFKRRGGGPQGRRGNNPRRGGDRREGKLDRPTEGRGNWMTNADREAADRRKARFAAA
ncbi:hypothetical protein EJ05DRAFT_502022 [Pseudovirgaria hyperparasitica]|uniref:SAP domain-containing protein n=1 Tax=Pseudovirgaria hyperparasitica TaxID=470096 RepID=A0A6A6W1U6_9PEZI|nr:uncharacterized protein EJ05DRAFT_502022 [Pseudovirgaria hyperparasitica]KAF2756515.1 hypothetical protein EJ05DRAFT_502022 [Pseudovirgaria hyperparasitica]